jgi:dTDP-4-dehydrorhamnose 3,5-epimerase-like enzyme
MRNSIVHTEVKSDERGWAVEPMDAAVLSEGKIKNIHVVSIEPGAVRGNHYHATKTEFVLIIGSGCQFWVVERDTRMEKCLVSDNSKPLLVKIPPMVSHAFRNVGESPVYLFCFGDQEYDPSGPDVFKHVIVE